MTISVTELCLGGELFSLLYWVLLYWKQSHKTKTPKLCSWYPVHLRVGHHPSVGPAIFSLDSEVYFIHFWIPLTNSLKFFEGSFLFVFGSAGHGIQDILFYILSYIPNPWRQFLYNDSPNDCGQHTQHWSGRWTWEYRHPYHGFMLTWVRAVIPGLLLDSHWWLEPMCWGTRHPRDPMFIEWVMVLLLESLKGWGSCGDNRFWHLSVVAGAVISRNSWLRREGVAGFGQLPLKSGRRKLYCLIQNEYLLCMIQHGGLATTSGLKRWINF